MQQPSASHRPSCFPAANPSFASTPFASSVTASLVLPRMLA